MATNQLESRLRKANLKYRKARRALIQKLEVPIRMTQAGLVATLSTVDFYGIFSYTNGTQKTTRAIAFDAKECESKTSFPLKNIHQHQLEYLKLWTELGAEGFFLIHFKKLHKDKAYVTPLSLVAQYWDDPSARRSIPISDFKDEWLVDIDDYLEFYDRTTSTSGEERTTDDQV